MTSKQNTSNRQLWLISISLAVLTAAAFEPVRHNDFVQYDDETYITQNPHVLKGLTWEGFRWAFTDNNLTANWHPLTWMSLMLDIELFGPNPLAFHLHNLLLHSISAVLLFYLLARVTGAIWPAAFVAMVFGIHPLRVESVAWAAERKDVLSVLFFMVTLAAYIHYTNKGGLCRYLFVILCFALGLTAKPMLVTVPIVLLILDFWPLQNPCRKTIARLITEKIPLLVLSLASCVVTYRVQQGGGSMMVNLPLHFRISNALFSYVNYIGKMLYPVKLGVLYPYSIDRPVWHVIAACLLLLTITGFAVYGYRRYPWLAAGWCWYLVTLFPVIGIVQVGLQASADRYTYLPSIGITIALAWGIAHLTETWPFRKILSGISICLPAAVLIVATRVQLTYWKDAAALFEHTLAVTENNVIMHSNLAVALERQNRMDLAMEHAQKAIRIQPESLDANNNMAIILIQQQQYQQAAMYAQKALQIQPNNFKAHNTMAVILAQNNQLDQAISHLQAALDSQPDDIESNNNMAAILNQRRQFDQAWPYLIKVLQIQPDNSEANITMADILIERQQYEQAALCLDRILPTDSNRAEAYYRTGIILEARGQLDKSEAAYQQALQSDPNHADVLCNLGVLCGKKGDFNRAVEYLLKSLQANPDSAKTCHNLGFALNLQGRTEQAVFYYRKAMELEPDNYKRYRDLASCLHAAGKSQEAADTVQKAIDLARSCGQTEQIPQMEQRLRLYREAGP